MKPTGNMEGIRTEALARTRSAEFVDFLPRRWLVQARRWRATKCEVRGACKDQWSWGVVKFQVEGVLGVP